MINNLGFRINKYLKISFIIGIIDLLIFYIVGRLYNDMTIFNLIVGNWKYVTLYISVLTIIIYTLDILFFFDRKRKYKMAFIFTEPFLEWNKYLYNSITIKKKDAKLNFYFDIYKKVSSNDKIIAITEDEILIRDIYIHLLTTNMLVVSGVFFLEEITLLTYLIVILCLVLVTIIVNLLYRQILKYYISEIYIDYLEKSKKN